MSTAPSAPVNLCETCRHVRLVRTRRGSVFFQCERSKTDPRFERYPRTPVVNCAGHEPLAGTE